jgi:hypothetical protein
MVETKTEITRQNVPSVSGGFRAPPRPADISEPFKIIGRGIVAAVEAAGNDVFAKAGFELQNIINKASIGDTNKHTLKFLRDSKLKDWEKSGRITSVQAYKLQRQIKPEYGLTKKSLGGGRIGLYDPNGSLVNIIEPPKTGGKPGKFEEGPIAVKKHIATVKNYAPNFDTAFSAVFGPESGSLPDTMRTIAPDLMEVAKVASGALSDIADNTASYRNGSVGASTYIDESVRGERFRDLESKLNVITGIMVQSNITAQDDLGTGPPKNGITRVWNALRLDLDKMFVDPDARMAYGISEDDTLLTKMYERLRKRIDFSFQHAITSGKGGTITEKRKLQAASATYLQTVETLSTQLNWSPEKKSLMANMDLLVGISKVVETLPGKAGDIVGGEELLRAAFNDTARLLIIKQISDIENISPEKRPSPSDFTEAIDSIITNKYIRTDITLFMRAKNAFDGLRKATDFKNNKLLKSKVDNLYIKLFDNADILKGIREISYHFDKAKAIK